MQYWTLGRSNLRVSSICLGTMAFGAETDEAAAQQIIQLALDSGINFFDTAEIYAGGQSERILGKALKGHRDRVIIATKARGPWDDRPGERALSRQRIIMAAEESLRRLDTDHIDLYYSHWPDPSVPLEETLRAFDELVRNGKVRFVALSNYPAQQLREAIKLSERHGLATPVALQERYNLLDRKIECELVPLCQQESIGIIAYSPLGGGFLTGKYQGPEPPPGTRASRDPAFARRVLTQRNFAILARVQAIAAEIGVSSGNLALAWALDNPGVTSAIVGARTPEQLAETLPGADLILSEDVYQRLNEASLAEAV